MNRFISISWSTFKNTLNNFTSHSNQFIKCGFLAVCTLLAISALPVAAQIPLMGISKIETGALHACALNTNGGVKCWGDNSRNQTGDSDFSAGSRTTAINVSGLSTGAIELAAGRYHTCALTDAGGVKCWGENMYGQLGNGTTYRNRLPNYVNTLTNGVVSISSQRNHSCALNSAGGVVCWGANTSGQLGDGTTITRLTPVPVIGLSSGVVAISVGDEFSCALTNVGTVRCWGGNSYYQLGNGVNANSLAPVDVLGLTNIVKISSGIYHSCALTGSQLVKCWGSNLSAQLGDGTTEARSAPVDALVIGQGVSDVTAGYAHTCVLKNGGAKCWGGNQKGELGNGTQIFSSNPVNVSGLSTDVLSVSASYNFTCANVSGGQVKCWGYNQNNQLGGYTFFETQPLPVLTMQSFSPVIGTATAGNTQAVVRFTPPLNDSGAPISGYTVISNPADGTDAFANTTDSYTGPAELSHLMTGLINGTTYSFTVTATNALGTGLPSTASNTVIPSTGSSAPASSSVPSSVSVSSSSLEFSSIPASSSSVSSVVVSSSSVASSVSPSSTPASSSIAGSLAASSSISSSVNVCSIVNGVTFGTTYTGSLATTDCTGGARGTSYYTDRYSFAGAPGQLVAIQLSGSFDTYVYLKNPSGTVIASNDDGGGGSNSRIPATSGNFTIPAAGTYVIEVTSYASSATGSYSLTVSGSAASSSSGVIVSSSSSAISTTSSISNSSAASSASPCNTTIAAVPGVTNSGALATTDCTAGARGASYYTDRYSFNGTSGQLIAIQLTSSAFDSYVYLKNPSGTVITSNDDGGGGTNSRIPATSGNFTLPASGTYVIEVTSYSTFRTGAYSLLFTRQ